MNDQELSTHSVTWKATLFYFLSFYTNPRVIPHNFILSIHVGIYFSLYFALTLFWSEFFVHICIFNKAAEYRKHTSFLPDRESNKREKARE